MNSKQRTSRTIRLLARRSFAASKMRNMIAVVAIMLTAILFTTVTTIGMGAKDSLTLTMQILKGSKSDGDFRYMTQEQYDALSEADFIESYGLRRPVGFLSNSVRHNVELDVMDETQAEFCFCTPSHGKMPQAANEVVTSDLAIQALGAQPEVGAQITVEFTARGQQFSLPMVVSGWYEAVNEKTSMMAASTAFVDAYPDLFRNTYRQDGEMAGTYWSDFTATSTMGLQENMLSWIRSVGGEPEDPAADNYLPSAVNNITNPAVSLPTVMMGGAIVLLFIFCGYLLIYNVFDISVMQEIRRYGLYRTIGISKRQVRRLINRQAVWLSCIGIPLGLLVGFFIGKAALPVVMSTMASTYENVVIRVSPSPVIFVGAAILTAFTVFLSTRKPVRVASGTPPIEAFHYVESSTGNRSAKKGFAGASLPRMAASNLGRNRRRSAFIMVSLMLCVVLLNCVGVAAGSVDVEKQVNMTTRTDFSVVNTASTNIMEGFTRRDQGVSQQTIQDIAARPGVIGGSAIYKNTIEDTNVTYDFGVAVTATSFVDQTTGLTQGSWDNDGFSGSLGSDGRLLCNVYGMEEVALSRLDLREGETDAHTLYEKMKHGQGALVGIDTNWSTKAINEDFDFTEIGDTITVYKDGQPLMELPVLAKAALNGDDAEIGYTCNGTFEVGGNALSIYLPTSVYQSIYDVPTIYKYSFDVEESQQQDMDAYLAEYMNNTDPTINYACATDARADAQTTRTVINLVGGLIGMIFAIAGVLNFVNTIITTILSRRHEFATMQSIGMTNGQLTKMMTFEGLYYALGACALGVILSFALGFTLVRGLTGTIWYFTFHFTLLPALLTCAVLLALSAIVPTAALRIFNKGSIVEKMRVAD